jgi:hypothetical protein
MAITSIDQLSPEMRQAAEPSLPIQNAIPDQQAALDQTQPAGQPSGAPAGPVAPTGAPPVPAQGIVSQIHDGVNQAAADTPVADRGKPGMWAKQILSGLSHAFSNVETSLGDIQTANESLAKSNPYGGGGIIGGLAALENAKAGRLQAAKVAQTKEDMDRAQIAKMNIDTHYQQVLLHSLQGAASDRANDAAIANGKVALDLATTGSAEYGIEPGKVIQKDINET